MEKTIELSLNLDNNCSVTVRFSQSDIESIKRTLDFITLTELSVKDVSLLNVGKLSWKDMSTNYNLTVDLEYIVVTSHTIKAECYTCGRKLVSEIIPTSILGL